MGIPKRSKAIVIVIAIGLTSCGRPFDPLTRDGVWHPNYVNTTDLTLQTSTPTDLIRGTGQTVSDGQLAAAAVDRLRTNKIKKLPDAGITEIKLQSQSGEASGGN